MKLLSVDDELGITTALSRGLVADGFGWMSRNGPSALAMAGNGHFDAIMLDIMLPGIYGHEVLKQPRARADWTPVLVLSAKDGEYDLADALDLGADDYLTKPFSYSCCSHGCARWPACTGPPSHPAGLQEHQP